MKRLYEHYNSQCEVETEGGEKQEGPWRRLPSYNRLIKYATGKSADCELDVFVFLGLEPQNYLIHLFIFLISQYIDFPIPCWYKEEYKSANLTSG